MAPIHPLEHHRINAWWTKSSVKSDARSDFDQPGGVKAIETAQAGVRVGEMARQRPKVPLRGYNFCETGDFMRVDRRPPHRRFAGEQVGDRLLALLRFQRTGAVDQHRARLEQADRL